MMTMALGLALAFRRGLPVVVARRLRWRRPSIGMTALLLTQVRSLSLVAAAQRGRVRGAAACARAAPSTGASSLGVGVALVAGAVRLGGGGRRRRAVSTGSAAWSTTASFRTFQEQRGAFLTYTLSELLYRVSARSRPRPLGHDARLLRRSDAVAGAADPRRDSADRLAARRRRAAVAGDGRRARRWRCALSYRAAVARAPARCRTPPPRSSVLQLTVLCLCLTGPVFNTQLGIQFWAMTGALFGPLLAAAERDDADEDERMAEGRLRRFVGGLGLGYLHTLVVAHRRAVAHAVLLRHLGSHDYGLWLLGAQVLVYLALMDLGVVAARAARSGLCGRARGAMATTCRARRPSSASTARLVLLAGAAGRARWRSLVRVVAAGGVGAAAMAAGHRRRRRSSSRFRCGCSTRVLQGLQDLAFLGSVQLVGVGRRARPSRSRWRCRRSRAVFAGGRLGRRRSCCPALVGVAPRWRRAFAARAARAARRALALSRRRGSSSARGTWISVNQIAQVLLGGTDLVVVGKLLGPEAVVPYACTGKLLTLLANQPQMFMQMALPALSELRDRRRASACSTCRAAWRR